mmetsp:Transcript_37491/g.119295  ORF Transcript_37491/g.119295 Transcript_37491/m.119295 type:complete len:256 (+) Transcript_37491:606-1373(+)
MPPSATAPGTDRTAAPSAGQLDKARVPAPRRPMACTRAAAATATRAAAAAAAARGPTAASGRNLAWHGESGAAAGADAGTPTLHPGAARAGPAGESGPCPASERASDRERNTDGLPPRGPRDAPARCARRLWSRGRQGRTYPQLPRAVALLHRQGPLRARERRRPHRAEAAARRPPEPAFLSHEALSAKSRTTTSPHCLPRTRTQWPPSRTTAAPHLPTLNCTALRVLFYGNNVAPAGDTWGGSAVKQWVATQKN